MYDKYIYEKFEFTDKYKQEVIEFIRHNTNIEIGGYKLWDGERKHLMQNPWELSDFIFALKRHEEETGIKLKRFLEVGFSSGINNTILNKFFNFDHIVGVDLFSSNLSGSSLVSNMLWKNLVLIVGDSTEKRTIDFVDNLAPYDLIFIDANHTYEYVKKDFENYHGFLSKGGVLGFHDVKNPDWPGMNKFWNELKETGKYNTQEFICEGYRLQYGIGMVTIK